MTSFVHALHRRASSAPLVQNIALALAGSFVLTLSAKINVPVWPVPVTLQTMAVAMLAALAGARLGVAMVITYLLQGGLGLPVFASGGGFAYLAGPTGGFLFGYIPMAFLIGWSTDRGATRHLVLLIAIMLVADTLLMAGGFAWLLIMAGSAAWIDAANPASSAWKGAVEPFILWDTIKMGLAALLVWKMRAGKAFEGRL